MVNTRNNQGNGQPNHTNTNNPINLRAVDNHSEQFDAGYTANPQQHAA
jgi:hypothetical protein